MKPSKYTERKQGLANPKKYVLLGLCICMLSTTGCFTRRSPASRIPTFIVAHPVIPAAPSAAPMEAPPEIAFEIAPPPRPMTPRNYPPRPRVTQTTPAEPVVTPEPADPMIVPELSAEQLKSAKSETQHSLEIAGWNLAQTQGKKLNTVQEDVASKIRGFMESARDAMKNSDWQRARNLAKKAEVLSHELVANL